MHFVPSRVTFIVPSEIKRGDTIEFGTPQIYECIGVEKTRNSKSKLCWQAPCLTCGALFDCHSGYVMNGINRNCDTHKRRAKYVVKRRRVESAAPVTKKAVTTTVKTILADKPCAVKAAPYTGPMIMHDDNWFPEAEFHEIVKKERLEHWAAQAKEKQTVAAPLSEEEERRQHKEQWEKDKASSYLDDLLG